MPRFVETKFHISPTTGVKDHFLVKAITIDNDRFIIETLGVKSAIQVANQLMVHKQRRFERDLSYDYNVTLISGTPTMIVKGDVEAAIHALRSLEYISKNTRDSILTHEEVKQIFEKIKNPQTAYQSEIEISERSPKKM